MTDEDRTGRATRWLLEEYQARRPFAGLPASLAPHTADEAYVMQEAFWTLLATTRGAIAGYKVALTTPVMQQRLGFHTPLAGAILAKTIHRSPCTIRSGDHVHLGIECEIAVQFGTDLPASGAPYSRDRVADAIGAVMPALELVDDRNADFSQLATQILSLIAANAWNAGIVLGAPVTDWRAIDLAAVRGTMAINGQVVGEGRGSDVLGHPLAAVAWLANLLAERGRNLSQGMVVITGAIVGLKFVSLGDTVQASVDGLGEVRLSVV